MARTALVLSGGAARGAYEVGVLRYLREELPRHLGRPIGLDIVCGTSVGAINACFIAATAEEPELQGKRLAERWTELRIDSVFPVGLQSWTTALARYLPGRRDRERFRRGGLLPARGIEYIVRRRIPWPALHRNVRSGIVQALSVCATEVASGRSVVWVETPSGEVPPWSRDPRVVARPATIGPLHALASAAIPILFPAIEVNGQLHLDGGVKQNTPLSPALRLGADRVVVIALRAKVARTEPVPAGIQPLFHAGRLFDSVFDDHLEYDLDRLRRFNALLDGMAGALGESGQRKLEAILTAGRGQPYRRVRDLLVQPSVDLGLVAAEYVRSRRFDPTARTMAGRILRALGERYGELVSFMLFDGGFASELIQLGIEDARRKEEELVRFFLDEAPAVVAAAS